MIPRKSDEDIGEDDEANKTDDDLFESISRPNETRKASIRSTSLQVSELTDATDAKAEPEEMKESERIHIQKH